MPKYFESMKYNSYIILFVSILTFQANLITGQEKSVDTVLIASGYGNIYLELYSYRAPLTCANFKRYIELAGNSGGEFYRTVRKNNQPDNLIQIDVIQGGFNISGIDSSLIRTVPLERTNLTGLRHLDGSISMARDAPDSGSTEFFICVGNQPELDFGGGRNPDGQGFGVFGRVIEGMEVVRKIHRANASGQALDPPIPILKITLE